MVVDNTVTPKVDKTVISKENDDFDVTVAVEDDEDSENDKDDKDDDDNNHSGNSDNIDVAVEPYGAEELEVQELEDLND